MNLAMLISNYPQSNAIASNDKISLISRKTSSIVIEGAGTLFLFLIAY